jgi:hypothetical protein
MVDDKTLSNSNFDHLVLFLLKIYISTYFHLKTYKTNHNNLIKLVLTLKHSKKIVWIPKKIYQIKKIEFWFTFLWQDENFKPLSWNSIL